MTLEVSHEEHALLLEILEEQAHALSTEINRTDSLEFKEALRRRSHLLDGLIQRFGEQPRVLEVGDYARSNRGLPLGPTET